MKYYKGKDAFNHKWIYGFYIEDEKTNGYIGVYLSYNRNVYLGARDFGKRLKQYAGLGFVAIEKGTQCIETGIDDKNGTRIFENDIVKLFDKYYVVVWLSDKCTFVLYDNKEEIQIAEFTSDNYEVVGNRFDNKEILK